MVAHRFITCKGREHLDELVKEWSSEADFDGLLLKDPNAIYESKRSDKQLIYMQVFEEEAVVSEFSEYDDDGKLTKLLVHTD